MRAAISIPISTDVYGYCGWARISNWVAQNIEMFSRYVDVIQPMFYPSHFPRDFLGSMEYLDDRAGYIYQDGSNRAAWHRRGRSLIRPYVQAFRIGGETCFSAATTSTYLMNQVQRIARERGLRLHALERLERLLHGHRPAGAGHRVGGSGPAAMRPTGRRRAERAGRPGQCTAAAVPLTPTQSRRAMNLNITLGSLATMWSAVAAPGVVLNPVLHEPPRRHRRAARAPQRRDPGGIGVQPALHRASTRGSAG